MSVNQPEDSLNEFERELADAMRRVDPPKGFAERTIALATTAPVESPTPKRAKLLTMTSHARRWVGGAIAATLLVGVFVGEETHRRHERERAELAQQQFEI